MKWVLVLVLVSNAESLSPKPEIFDTLEDCIQAGETLAERVTGLDWGGVFGKHRTYLNFAVVKSHIVCQELGEDKAE